MIELTEDQGRQFDVPAPIAIDPRTKKTCVLFPEAIYQRFRGMLDGDANVLASAEMVDQIMSDDDANDPYLEEYQSY
jgi:hypothetical protein